MTNPEPPPVPKKRGCFFYGCIISLVLLLLFVGGSFLGFYLIKKSLHQMVADYTQTSPAQMPVVDMPPAELKQLKQRIADFNDALKAHTNTPPLVLTSQELDALIDSDPQVKGKCYVSLEGDKIKGQISLPLDDLADVPFFRALGLDLKGRYLNGACTFKAAIENNELFVHVESLEVNGKPLPDSFMNGFRQQNLADSFNKDKKNAKLFEQYESLEVKDNTIIVKAKAQ